jgi:hypothetical protein
MPSENLAARMVQSSGAGVVVLPEDHSALVEQATQLAGNPERRKEMGGKARAYAEQKFNIDLICDKFEVIALGVTRRKEVEAMTKAVLVCGAGGFIGSHLVKRLKKEGMWVRGVDLKFPEFGETEADDFVIGDLRDQTVCDRVVDRHFDEAYQLAADMGGAGYVFTGENDADIMHNSAVINLNMVDRLHKRNCKRVFYSSSACMYPAYNQEDPDNPNCREDSAYPAAPDSEYGW